jgi:hypothetical protein
MELLCIQPLQALIPMVRAPARLRIREMSEALRVLQGHSAGLYDVAWSPDGRRMVGVRMMVTCMCGRPLMAG